MEALIELLKTPEGALILEGLGLLGIGILFTAFLWVFRDAREGRRGLHEKIDNKAAELHARIDEGQKEVHDHMLEDARMWGLIAGKMGIDLEKP